VWMENEGKVSGERGGEKGERRPIILFFQKKKKRLPFLGSEKRRGGRALLSLKKKVKNREKKKKKRGSSATPGEIGPSYTQGKVLASMLTKGRGTNKWEGESLFSQGERKQAVQRGLNEPTPNFGGKGKKRELRGNFSTSTPYGGRSFNRQQGEKRGKM